MVGAFGLGVITSGGIFCSNRTRDLAIPCVSNNSVAFLTRRSGTIIPVRVNRVGLIATSNSIGRTFIDSNFLRFLSGRTTLVYISIRLPRRVSGHHTRRTGRHTRRRLHRGVDRFSCCIAGTGLSHTVRHVGIGGERRV